MGASLCVAEEEDDIHDWVYHKQFDSLIRTKTIQFQPGSLGMSVRWGEGVVTNMDQGSQTEKLGVKVGWKLINVGNDEYTEDILDKYIAENKPFSITFKTNPNPEKKELSEVKVTSLKNTTSDMDGATDDLEPYKVDLCLVAHKDEPWGVQVNFDTWLITRVDRDKQFNKLGIRVGYKILRVDGVPVTFRRKKYQAMLMNGVACQLTVLDTVKAFWCDFKPDFQDQHILPIIYKILSGRDYSQLKYHGDPYKPPKTGRTFYTHGPIGHQD